MDMVPDSMLSASAKCKFHQLWHGGGVDWWAHSMALICVHIGRSRTWSHELCARGGGGHLSPAIPCGFYVSCFNSMLIAVSALTFYVCCVKSGMALYACLNPVCRTGSETNSKNALLFAKHSDFCKHACAEIFNRLAFDVTWSPEANCFILKMLHVQCYIESEIFCREAWRKDTNRGMKFPMKDASCILLSLIYIALSFSLWPRQSQSKHICFTMGSSWG